MGVVYRALDTRLSREVALKFLPDRTELHSSSLERFGREARAASRINHPHICTVYDVGEHEGKPFLVMELLEGETLKHRLASGRVVTSDFLEWCGQIADGLEAAHNAGIVHRDIKPANLFITKRGQAKILDFGLAQLAAGQDAIASGDNEIAPTLTDFQTTPGQTVGTVSYMSPEQARGEELDRRTDIFSLGIVMYEMASGELPFEGATPAVVFHAILSLDPPSVLARNPGIPAALAGMIDKALEKDRKLRYQTAADLLADLERVKRGFTANSAQATVASRNSSKWLALTVGALLLTASVGGAVYWRKQRESTFGELILKRVTSNSSTVPVFRGTSLSPDRRYLAYSDSDGVHLRSFQTSESRLIPQTKNFHVSWWAENGSEFYAWEEGAVEKNFRISAFGGAPYPLGNAVPSPGGKYSLSYFSDHVEVTPLSGGKPSSFKYEDTNLTSWSLGDSRVALVTRKNGMYGIDSLDLENGRRSTMVSAQKDAIRNAVWLADNQLLFAKQQAETVIFSNLWSVRFDPSTYFPIQPPQQRTHWSDVAVLPSSLSSSGNRVTFTRATLTSDVLVGETPVHGVGLGNLHQLTFDDSQNLPCGWMPDGKAILFVSNREGSWHLYKQGIADTAAELISTRPYQAQWCYVSPDGSTVITLNVPPGGKTRFLRLPLAGGALQEVLLADASSNAGCSRVPGGTCVLAEGKAEQTFSLFDPIKGRGAQILKISGKDAGVPSVSADGSRIAFVLPGEPHNRIRILNLQGSTVRDIVVSDAKYLASLEWTADGKGFYCGDNAAGEKPAKTRLLQIQMSGTAQTLFETPGTPNLWGMASRDGRQLATWRANRTTNVWMVENVKF